MKIALFGAGRIGQVHASSIQAESRSQLVAVSDVIPDAAHALARAYKTNVLTADDIFADDQIDGILIASSTHTHADLIERGIKAGKAIFCEKPIDLSLDRALAVQAAAKGYAKPIMLGFNRRFDPNFSMLRTALRAGDIGTGELLNVTSYDPAPPPVDYIKVSGGIFRDMMIHDFDMCAFLFGMPQAITAHGSCLIDPDIAAAGDIDTAVAVLQYADGRLATIRNSRRAAFGYDQRVEVLGSTGMLSAENVREHTLTHATQHGLNTAKPLHFFLERYMKAYAIEWSAFVDAYEQDTQPPATIDDGVNALMLAEAAQRSKDEGRTVHLPL